MFRIMKVRAVLVLSLIFTAMPLSAEPDEGKMFLDATVSRVKEKCKGKKYPHYVSCLHEHSPERCQNLGFVSMEAWGRCVYSCGNSGFFSRSFGECSTW